MPIRIQKYGIYPGGWNFSSQYGMAETRRMNRKDSEESFWAYESTCTIRVNGYGYHRALPGQKVWVIAYDKARNRFEVVSDIIHDVHCFGPVFTGGLRHYWLRRARSNTGLDFGDRMWFTKSQAENALKKLNYFADRIRMMEWNAKNNREIEDEEGREG